MIGRRGQKLAGSTSTTKGGLVPRQLVEQLVTAVEDALAAQQALSDTYLQTLLRKNVGHFSRLIITFFVARIIKIRPDIPDCKFALLYFDI